MGSDRGKNLGACEIGMRYRHPKTGKAGHASATHTKHEESYCKLFLFEPRLQLLPQCLLSRGIGIRIDGDGLAQQRG